jgi:molecular chaperone GrpE
MSKPKQPKKPEESEKDSASQPQGTQPAPEQPPMVALTLDEYSALEKQRDEARQQAREFSEGWQRERADFQNYKRRVERDQSQVLETTTGRIVKKYLVILDDLERALKTRPTEGQGAAWAEGVELIVRKLHSILDQEGVKRIPAEEQLFDPNLHEAITHEDHPERKSGEVIEVVQQGYMIGERVLRPALVRVAR